MIVSNDLARRLEAAEAIDAAGCADAACKVVPECGAVVRAAAGGVLTFCGETSPLTHAIGLGMHGPVTEAELDEIEEFFQSRGAAAVIDVCPHADPSFPELLSGRGYRISELNNVLVRQAGCVTAAAAEVDIQQAHDAELFAQTVIRGFFGRNEILEEEMRLGRMLFHMPCSTPLLAFVGGRPAGAAALSIRNGIASFYGDAVLTDFRNRGVHSALISHRLNASAAAGCEIATAVTVPGSASQTHYQKLGFEVAYTKITMVLT